MAVLTKTGLAAGRACDLRAYRSLVLGQWGMAPPTPTAPALVAFRARHTALADLHRLWLKRGEVDRDALPEVWDGAWRRSGGEEPSAPDGLEWLRAYVADNPFLGRGRVLVGVEATFRAAYLGRRWQARPDLVTQAPDGTVEVLELSSARHPLLDRRAVETMSAIDLLVLSGYDVPTALREAPHRVIICTLDDYREIDVTLERPAAREVLAGIAGWLDGLSAETARPSPSLDTCGRCVFQDRCPHALVAPAAGTASVDADAVALF